MLVQSPQTVPNSLLAIEGLSIAFPSTVRGAADIPVVQDVSLRIERSETVGIVGESGSGKSMTALAALRLVPPPGRIVRGEVRLSGRNVLGLPEFDMRSIRGGKIAMIFQDPMTSLNPVFTVGDQIAESVRLHRRLSGRAAFEVAVDAMKRVHIALPDRRARQYPHELSGGMRQRVMIAMALASQPALLLADEPTTALDVTVQAQILALLAEIQHDTGMGILLITHDLAVVAEACDRVVVMYGGRIMEEAPATSLFDSPKHPYTQGLLASLPDAIPAGSRRLPFIAGQPPTAGQIIDGCPFRTRCNRYMPGVCELPLVQTMVAPNHTVRCHLYSSPSPISTFASEAPG